jgi:acetoin utilization deacetylase AcuC-like enzyme
MARTMRRLGAELEAPVGLVLEGGYALDALARSVASTLQALAGPVSLSAPEVPLVPDSLAARERLARWWPVLGAQTS